MTRNEAITIATQIAKVLFFLEESGKDTEGVKFVAGMIAKEICKNGRIDEAYFMSLCGITTVTTRHWGLSTRHATPYDVVVGKINEEIGD